MLLKKHQTGLTLLEVMVALSILSISLLALLGSVSKGLSTMQGANYHRVAKAQVLQAYEHLTAVGSENLASYVSAWKTQNKALFPEVTDSIDDLGSQYAVNICWQHHTKQCDQGVFIK